MSNILTFSKYFNKFVPQCEINILLHPDLPVIIMLLGKITK